jgi:hypothetical protein
MSVAWAKAAWDVVAMIGRTNQKKVRENRERICAPPATFLAHRIPLVVTARLALYRD